MDYVSADGYVVDGNGRRQFADQVPGVQPGTSLSAVALNPPTNEIVNAIKQFGLTPSANDETQLGQAIEASVTAETKRAQGAETSLAAQIQSEASRATQAEDNLGQKISSEISRAQGVEGNLASQISAETTRAKQVENNIATAITSVGALQTDQFVDTTQTGTTTLTLAFTPKVSGVVMLTGSFSPSAQLSVSGSSSTQCTLSTGDASKSSQTRLSQTLLICAGLTAGKAYNFTFSVQVNVATSSTAALATLGYIFVPTGLPS